MTTHDLVIGFFVLVLAVLAFPLAWFLVDIWFWDEDGE